MGLVIVAPAAQSRRGTMADYPGAVIRQSRRRATNLHTAPRRRLSHRRQVCHGGVMFGTPPSPPRSLAQSLARRGPGIAPFTPRPLKLVNVRAALGAAYGV
jgi:hypothetical protein